MERFLVVDIVSNPHQAIGLAGSDELAEGRHIGTELRLAEDGIDRCQHKGLTL